MNRTTLSIILRIVIKRLRSAMAFALQLPVMNDRSVFLLIVISAFSVGLFLQTILYSEGWKNRAHARADLTALELENKALNDSNRDLEMQILALSERPDVQRRVIRQELGYVTSNDLVIEGLPRIADHIADHIVGNIAGQRD